MAAGDERCIAYIAHRPFEPCAVDVALEDGQELAVNGLHIRCLAAPGHCQGLAVFEMILNGERIWFSGDLFEVLTAHTWIKMPFTGSPDFDRATYVASLRHLLALPPCDHLLPGHGPAAIGCGRRLIEMAYTEAMMNWR